MSLCTHQKKILNYKEKSTKIYWLTDVCELKIMHTFNLFFFFLNIEQKCILYKVYNNAAKFHSRASYNIGVTSLCPYFLRQYKI